MHSGFGVYLHRRQALLFLIAILVPCVVLLALGLRTIDQERQLESKRLFDEQQLLIEQTRQALLSDLEKIKLQQVTRAVSDKGRTDAFGRKGPVAFVGPIVDGQLLLPWENSSRARKFQELLNEENFALRIRDGEKQEVAAHQYENAVRQYRDALDAAKQPAQQSYARLLLARALQKSGRLQESQAEYERVIMSPSDLVDDLDVPLGLYAGPPLLQAGTNRTEILAWVRLVSDEERIFPPVALRMARDLAAKIGASESISALDDLIREREQAEGLRRDLPRVAAASRDPSPVWTAYGEPAWLTSVTAPVGDLDGLVIAVRANDALRRVNAEGRSIRLAEATDTAGQALGESFPGFRVLLPKPVEQNTSSRQTFLAVATAVALVFAMLAGYLLWRDVQRDLRLSEMRSQFVSSVTHELKTPLTAIRMFTETLRLDEEVDRQTRIEYLDTILQESERLSRLVDNVLDFGKIERGKKTYRFEPVQLEEVVEQAARTAQYPLEEAGFALDVDTARDLPTVQADSDALQQAILNLLTNAMKYSGNSRSITLRLDRMNGHARIHVEDHGIGIAPEEQQRIFERFYRAPTAENQHIPGTGLGLTIVAHIANAHGGRVEVASQPGNGSSFTISLPLSGANAT